MAVLRSLMFLLIIFSVGNANVVLEEKCPYGWTNYGVRCYKFFLSSVNWITAEKNCQSVGGNLASVHSKPETDFLLSMLPSLNTVSWIGGHDGEQEGQWLWTNGNEFQYTNWCATEPNSQGVENCLEINWTSNRCWNDATCSQQKSYICETEL